MKDKSTRDNEDNFYLIKVINESADLPMGAAIQWPEGTTEQNGQEFRPFEENEVHRSYIHKQPNRRDIWNIYWEPDYSGEKWGLKNYEWTITEEDLEYPDQIEVVIFDKDDEKRVILKAFSGNRVVKAEKVDIDI